MNQKNSTCISVVHILWVLIFIFSTTIIRSQPSDQYMNPVGDTIFVADPYILHHAGVYYLYGTSTGEGFKAWKSENLVQWSAMGYVYRKAAGSWAAGSFWAPEVIHYGGKFYLIFSCRRS